MSFSDWRSLHRSRLGGILVLRGNRWGLIVLLGWNHLYRLLSGNILLLGWNHLHRLLIHRLLSELLHWCHGLLNVSFRWGRFILFWLDL